MQTSKSLIIRVACFVSVVFSLAIAASAQNGEVEDCFVVLSVEFLETGKVGEVTLTSTNCAKDSGLEQKAFEAARKIKFKPKMEDGKAVTIFKDVRYDFTVKKNQVE